MKPDLSNAIPITHPRDYTFDMVNGVFYYEYIYKEDSYREIKLAGNPVWFVARSPDLVLTRSLEVEVYLIDTTCEYEELVDGYASIEFNQLLNYHYLSPEHYPEYYI